MWARSCLRAISTACPGLLLRRTRITPGLGASRFHFSIGVPDDYGHSLFVCFNKDMFEREGLPDPYELYEQGLWNWDTVEDLAIKLTKDTDGDGVNDQFGFHWIDPTYYIFANGGQQIKADENGRMVFAMQDEAVYEALRRYHQWQNVLRVTTGDWQFLDFEQGKAAMAWMPFYEIHQVDYEFNFGVLPLPHGPNVDECVFPPGVGDAIFIPANAVNPLALVALDNFLWPVDTYYELLDDAIRGKVADMNATKSSRGHREVGRPICQLLQLPGCLLGWQHTVRWHNGRSQ